MELQLKKGALRRMLQIPEGEKIPQSLLSGIITTPEGRTYHNKTGIGKKEIKVTELVLDRTRLAKTMSRWHHKKQKRR